MQLRDHVFLGMTQSLCPECLALVPAKIIARQGRVYFRKRCPTHGVREDFVCSDVRQYDRMEFSLQGKVPAQFGTEPDRGCPFDCGLCTEHEQHTCVGLVEITSSCNLNCPMCYAGSGPGGKHLSFDECRAAIDRLVEVEGRPEVLQLSGGEPTIHPEFLRILQYGCRQPIDLVMINTNGLRFAHDPELVAAVAGLRQRLEIYFQFDGFKDETSRRLRGESLVETKLKALEALGRAGLRVILVCTLQTGVNDDEIGAIVKFGLERPWITGVSFQPATYSGRHVLPETLERRITFPDVVRAIAEQTDGLYRETDFLPLPCAHPNCHSLSYAYRSGGSVTPISRFIDAENHLDLLANGITFTRARARELIESYLGRLGCCAGGDCTSDSLSLREKAGVRASDSLSHRERAGVRAASTSDAAFPLGSSASDVLPVLPVDALASANGSARIAQEFFSRALAEQLSPSDVFRITITSFLDAYNFDVRRLMKCCIHHVLPSGHVIPFCAYNVLYRDGHVPLPELRDAIENIIERRTALET
ncbi:MAG TPA: radical SAM protein [Pirellulales bacterium]|nr:radical SAM protein [Pirellulales bacterium]